MTTSATRRDSGNVWTAQRIRAQGVRMDAVDAVKAVHGVGTTRAYEALRAGEDVGFRVLRLGRRYIAPTADVLRVLGLDEVAEDDPSAA